MSDILNIVLYTISLLVLVVPMGFWTWRLLKRLKSAGHESMVNTEQSRRTATSLVWWYAVFAVLILCDGVHVLNVCVAETVDWSLLMSMLTICVLFFFPVLTLLQQIIIEAHPVNGQTIAIYLLPSVLYTTFITYLRMFYGLEHIIATPWMHQVEIIGYYYILFLNIIVGLFLVVWRGKKYHYRVCNYYPDRNKSDDAAVKSVAHVALLAGVFVYFFLLTSLESLNNNWTATGAVIAIICFILNYLGHALCSVKGSAIPADMDWKGKTLTEEEIASLEERYRQAGELLSAENATKNISTIIEKWVGQPNPSYLRAGITLTEVAYEMKIPANILSGYINKTLDTNFNQWINAYRLKHVKYLLLTTNKTLDEIAEATGFATRNLLSRTFKAHEGITPSEFRSTNVNRKIDK